MKTRREFLEGLAALVAGIPLARIHQPRSWAKPTPPIPNEASSLVVEPFPPNGTTDIWPGPQVQTPPSVMQAYAGPIAFRVYEKGPQGRALFSGEADALEITLFAGITHDAISRLAQTRIEFCVRSGLSPGLWNAFEQHGALRMEFGPMEGDDSMWVFQAMRLYQIEEGEMSRLVCYNGSV